MSSRRNIEVGPVRWKFIKSPVPREPYKNIKKLYEIELANYKAKKSSNLSQLEIQKIRAKTRLILKKKYQKELLRNAITLSIIIISATILIWFLVN